MANKYDIGDGWSVVQAASGCEDHKDPVSFEEKDIAACLWFEAKGDSGDGSSSQTILRLKDGRYVLAEEDSDSSGHG